MLQIRSVEFAGKYQSTTAGFIQFWWNADGRIYDDFKKNVGTLITTDEGDSMEQPIISGIAFNRDEAKVSILAVPDRPGIASSILSPISAANIEIDMIIQNIAENGLTDFTFTVNRGDFDKTLAILGWQSWRLAAKKSWAITKLVKVSLVGVGMRSHAGGKQKMFETLAENNINIQMISTSEIKISVLIQGRTTGKSGLKRYIPLFGLDREDGESRVAGL